MITRSKIGPWFVVGLGLFTISYNVYSHFVSGEVGLGTIFTQKMRYLTLTGMVASSVWMLIWGLAKVFKASDAPDSTEELIKRRGVYLWNGLTLGPLGAIEAVGLLLLGIGLLCAQEVELDVPAKIVEKLPDNRLVFSYKRDLQPYQQTVTVTASFYDDHQVGDSVPVRFQWMNTEQTAHRILFIGMARGWIFKILFEGVMALVIAVSGFALLVMWLRLVVAGPRD